MTILISLDMSDIITPEKAPSLCIPAGTNTCTVSMIDTTCSLTVPADTLVEPPIKGHELMNFPTYAFHIQHDDSGRQLLFDLGCRKDFWNLPAPIAEVIDRKVPGIRVDKDLADILVGGGMDLSKLEAAIVSHHHYDHTGNPSSFPRSMALIFGPGFSKSFMPGYPSKSDSPFHEDAFEGREVIELSFDDSQLVAGYRAKDYFDDGSMYILDTPGHAIGHISALVRTTYNSYVFLGADICHFGGSFRPTPYVPLPPSLSSVDLCRDENPPRDHPFSTFTCCHPNPDRARTVPYYEPCSREDSWYVNPREAKASIDRLQVLDASEKVLVLIAHDPVAAKVLPLFPEGTLNGWLEAGWKQKLRWGFLDELPQDGRERRYLVDGTYRDGRLIKTLDGRRVG